MEECYLRELFVSIGDVDSVAVEMKAINFEPYNISKVARCLLLVQHCDKETLVKKIQGMELGEEVPSISDGHIM